MHTAVSVIIMQLLYFMILVNMCGISIDILDVLNIAKKRNGEILIKLYAFMFLMDIYIMTLLSLLHVSEKAFM